MGREILFDEPTPEGATMKFQRYTKEDAAVVFPYLMNTDKRACEYTPVTFSTWMPEFDIEFCIEDDVLYLRSKNVDGVMGYWLPIRRDGGCDRQDILRLLEYCGGQETRFCFLSERETVHLTEEFGAYDKSYEEAFCDYLYLAEEMRTFPGRKFGKKRNHLHQYVKAYGEPVFCEITAENIREVESFYRSFASERVPQEGFEEMEHRAVLDTLRDFFYLSLVGGFLRIGENIVGFSVGEYKGDTLFVHVEKADISYRGVYATLVKCFAERFAREVTYVNREEDMGEEGLRRSKLSFFPVEFVKKYSIFIPGQR